VQNCYGDVAKYFDTESFEESEKCEGSSMTVYFRDGEFGCCSRNLDLKESEDNTFWKMAIELDLKNKLTTLGKNIAIQGELCGPGIQNNIYKLTKHMFFVFDVFDIDKFEYWAPVRRRALTVEFGLTDAPVYSTEKILAGKTRDELLDDADGQSVLGTVGCLREGVVYKANSDKRISFKCVSNAYLLGEK
jgi:RNA ligase (TIGR02306 family)